jgi:hypothetical protein
MSTIKANTLLHSDGSTTTQPSIPALDKRMAKVWVTFASPVGTVTIKDSYGVSSVTDRGVGLYTVNYSTSFSNTDYCFITSSVDGGGENDDAGVGCSDGKTTTGVALYTYHNTGNPVALNDVNELHAVIFSA